MTLTKATATITIQGTTTSGHAHDHAAELREASRRSLTIALVLSQG